MKRIVHISTVKELTPGQKNQLYYEKKYADEVNDFNWKVVVLCDITTEFSAEIEIPSSFRSNLGRKLYFWIWCIKNLRKDDVLIQRYSNSDIFSLIFGWMFRGRYLVHHSIEYEEMKTAKKGLKKPIMLFVEFICSQIISMQVKGHLSVTDEIGRYYERRSKKNKVLKYYNGIDPRAISITIDRRELALVNIIFVASSFSSWHGLDLLLDDISNSTFDGKCVLHVVGKIFEADLSTIAHMDVHNIEIECHGILNKKELSKLLEKIDVGLSSFALYRKSMEEATTLKVREYLCAGVPVYSGHIDSAFPKEFKYYINDEPDISRIYNYGIFLKKTKRSVVKDASIPYISKRIQMSKIVKLV